MQHRKVIMTKADLLLLIQQLTSLDFWEKALDSFQALGPVVPVVLAALESIIPPLPLVAIVTLNIAGHGAILGFLYSWIGTCLGCTIMFFFTERYSASWWVIWQNVMKRSERPRTG